METNYVSVHAKYYKTSHYKRMVNHNTRKVPPKYVLNTGYENRDFNFDKSFDDLLQDKEQVLKRKNTASKKDENTIVEFVCALSIEETKKILSQKDGYEKLCQGFKLTMEAINKEFGLTPVSYSFHGDEGYHIDNDPTKEIINNFHSHLVFFNYDFKKERSVLRNLKPKDFSKMQDIAAECFQSLKMDYHRGEGKITKAKDHLERRDFIAVREAQKQEEKELEMNKNEFAQLSDIAAQSYEEKEQQLKQREQQLKQEEEYKEVSEDLKKNEIIFTVDDFFSKFSTNIPFYKYGISEKDYKKAREDLILEVKKLTLLSKESEVIKKHNELAKKYNDLKAQNEALKTQMANDKVNDKTSELNDKITELTSTLEESNKNLTTARNNTHYIFKSFGIDSSKSLTDAFMKLEKEKKSLDEYREKERKEILEKAEMERIIKIHTPKNSKEEEDNSYTQKRR